MSGDFPDALRKGSEALEAGQVDAATASLERAREMIPEYADESGPYGLLAQRVSPPRRQGRRRPGAHGAHRDQ